jgi:hypothetical protein
MKEAGEESFQSSILSAEFGFDRCMQISWGLKSD